MKVSNLPAKGSAPSDCTIASHKLMVRGGYMKYMANGIYSICAHKAHHENRKIIREEMDRIDGQRSCSPSSCRRLSGSRAEGIPE
ncbi:MAG: hypothetical protein ACLVKR_04285 [Lachnospiraceae bacterium]